MCDFHIQTSMRLFTVTSMVVCDCLWYCWGTCTWLKSYFAVYFYGFSWFLSFMIICMYVLGLHKISDVLVTVQPPSSVNQFISLIILTIAQPHPATVFLTILRTMHALNCGWLWSWLYRCCPAPVIVACPCSLHHNDSSWYTSTHNMPYSCVEWGYAFEHTVWDYIGRHWACQLWAETDLEAQSFSLKYIIRRETVVNAY